LRGVFDEAISSVKILKLLKSKKNIPILVVIIIFLFITSIYIVLGFFYSFILKICEDPGTAARFGVDFKCYYAVSKMLTDGNPEIYDNSISFSYLDDVGLTMIPPGRVTYPPCFYFMMTPVTYLSLEKSANMWAILKYPLIIVISVLLSLLIFEKEKRIWLKVIATVVIALAIYAFSPTLDDIICGQVNLHLLLLLVSVIFFYRKDWQILTGILLGLIFCIKLISILIIVYFLINKKWKVVIASIGTFFVISLPVIFLCGTRIYRDYISTLPDSIRLNLNYLNMSMLAKILYYLDYFKINFPNRFVYIKFVYYLFVLTVLIITFYFLVKYKKKNDIFLDFSILITTTILISPIIWAYHHIWLFIPMGYIAYRIIYGEESVGLKMWETVILLITYFPLAIFDGMSGSYKYAWIGLMFIKPGVPLLLVFILWLFLLIFKKIDII